MNKKQWTVFGFVFIAFMVYFFLLFFIFHFALGVMPITSSDPGAWGVYVLSNLKCTIYISFGILCFAVGLACLICGWLEKEK
jgi:hypothetical protein